MILHNNDMSNNVLPHHGNKAHCFFFHSSLLTNQITSVLKDNLIRFAGLLMLLEMVA